MEGHGSVVVDGWMGFPGLGTSFGFWVDFAVARLVVWLRDQDVWIPRACFLRWHVSCGLTVLGLADKLSIWQYDYL